MVRRQSLWIAVLAGAALVVPAAAHAQPEPTPAEGRNEPKNEAKGNPEERNEGKGKEEELELPAPRPFNFADFDKFGQEKCLAEGKSRAECGASEESEKEIAKEHEAPVTPFVYILGNALILYAIYYYGSRKAVGAGLAARRATIAKELEEAATIKAEAQAKLEEYSGRLEKLDQELDRMKAELTAAGEKDRDRIVKEAEEKADRMRKDAQFLLDQEIKQLRIDLLAHTVDVAAAAAEQVLKGKLTSQDQQRINDEYLTQIAALPAPGALGAVKEGKAAS